jgi:Zn-dependent M16 (insulinase) family peptidase
MVRFIREINDDVRTTHKQQLLSITKEDIQRAGKKYLKDRKQTGICLMGPEVENAKGDWDIIHLD